jgi:hypothetical protein
MGTNEIIRQLKDERSKLDAAIQALEGVGDNAAAKRRGRPPGIKNKPTSVSAAPKKRAMSAAARKRIAESMRKRWAAAKRAGKKGL